MADPEPRRSTPPRLSLANNNYLVNQMLRDPDSFHTMLVAGVCEKGVYVVSTAKSKNYREGNVVLWDNRQINRALIKTFGRKVRRA